MAVRKAEPWPPLRCGLAVLTLLAGLSLALPARAGPSSYSRGSGGAKAFYLLLQDLGYKVARVAPKESLGDKTSVAVILGQVPDAEEDRILKWVKGGHLLILALPLWDAKGHCADVSLGSLSFKRVRWWKGKEKGEQKTPHPNLDIRASACRMRVPDRGRLLAGTEEEALAMEMPAGQGKVLVLAHEDLVVNANLNRDDLVVLVRRWLSQNAPSRGRVDFIEEQRTGAGILATLGRAGLWAFLLHGLLWLILLYWSKAPRFGDPTPVFPTTRREFSQHARTLGHLYQRRRAAAHVLRQQWERFLDRLTGRPDPATTAVGVRASASATRRSRLRQSRAALAALVATRTGREAASVESLLAQIEYSIDSPATDVREVQRYFRLSQSLAALQHTSAAPSESGGKRGIDRKQIR